MIPLRADGRAELVAHDELAALSWPRLIAWCYTTGRYTIATTELVCWLHDQIGGQRAIEVGAGAGDLGYHVGIPQSDSGLQTDPDLRRFYAFLGQRAVTPPPDVERLTANDAVMKYEPDMVIASWLTQRYQPGDEGRIGSSIGGADEFDIVERATYIHIGNLNAHHQKRILALKHKELKPPWLWTRGQRPELNRIWIWERGARAA